MPEIDWTESMQQTFEFWKVDPITWYDETPLTKIKSCSIVRDDSTETLQNGSFEATDLDEEMYVRVYLIVVQHRTDLKLPTPETNTFKIPLATLLVQTPSTSFDGKEKSSSMDAYSTLIELKEKQPDIGFTVTKGTNIMERAGNLTREHCRAPVIVNLQSRRIVEYESGFVANMDDTWLKYLSDLIGNAEFKFGIEPTGDIFFRPVQDFVSLQPVWTYTDDNSSILLPEVTISRDLYGIPNVVEVVHSTGGNFYVGRCVNDDPDSPISTVRRGREIVKRINSPDTLAMADSKMIDDYARQQLRNLSTLEYKVSYSHGYCPVTVGDCVRLNYIRAGITNTKAKVVKQTIKCETGCTVSEEAIFTNRLWGG